MKRLEEIREYISCPQFGDDHYGKWGALTLEQRATIYDLINIVECDDIEIKRLKQENARLKDLYRRTSEHLFKIGNTELAMYFQAQINDCPSFVPQDLRGDE